MAAYAAQINPDTESCYVSTNRRKSLSDLIKGTFGTEGELSDEGVDEIAEHLPKADIVGFSSMTGYADLTRRVTSASAPFAPRRSPSGPHPPRARHRRRVDAVCTGEGEFAFREFYDLFTAGKDYAGVGNFWFKGEQDGHVIRIRSFTLARGRSCAPSTWPSAASTTCASPTSRCSGGSPATCCGASVPSTRCNAGSGTSPRPDPNPYKRGDVDARISVMEA